MVTLIAVYNSDGCAGRCDARCYGAKHPDCNCICGGKNHSAGLQQAMDNTREMVEGWVEEFAEKNNVQLDLAEVLGKISVADKVEVPTGNEKVYRKNLTGKQYTALKQALFDLNFNPADYSKRTINSLSRRGLLNGAHITELGEAVLRVLSGKAGYNKE